MNYIRTGRRFNYAVRTEDAYTVPGSITTDGSGQTTMRWQVNWKNLIPTDIQPNSTFVCRHTFEEGNDALQLARDNISYNRRGFDLFCNLPSYSAASNANSNVPGGLAALNANQTGKNGFIGSMVEKGNTLVYSSTTYGGNPTPLAVYYLTGKYTSAPYEFEVLSPENYSTIEIQYAEMSPPLTYTQLVATTLYGANTNTITYGGGDVLPQFQQVSPAKAMGSYNLIGTHIFEFELVEKVPSDNRV